ncbi:MAG: U32 family peptidase [Bacteroidales bacterium]|jgi:putative protease|nr:U32 family peptidase [Bacteroidales bacterium]
MYKPELLLPAGNLESFFAAIQGGADAVYLGLKKFNARNRAKNFSYTDLYNIIKEAHSRKKKIYVTLNTLIKNEELNELIEVLGVLSQLGIDALIIQDIAILNLVKKIFRNLKIHASTQMGVHNSAGCNFFEKQGFERVILSRELTRKELEKISGISKIQKEIFIHGALCYSFSGYCLFSSYLGGNSANRGLCAQVCRRSFISENNEDTFFSLKDFQLIDLIPLFSELKISSLKIEGRMKNPEYIYNTARAYRIAIDDHSRIPEAKKLLKYDFAREKTTWFMGGGVKESITSNTGTGIYIGKINSIDEKGFEIITDIKIDKGSKIRLRNNNDTEAEFIKIQNITNNKNCYFIYCNTKNLLPGMDIYLAGTGQHNFKDRFSGYEHKKILLPGQKQKEIIKKSFKIIPVRNPKTKIYVRISDPEYIDKMQYSDIEAVFLKLRYRDLEKIPGMNIPAGQKKKLYIELPKFIGELKIKYVRDLMKKLSECGYDNFVISHISQIDLLPKNVNINSNENVYLLNDIAIDYINSTGIKNYCYPLENDYPNLLKGNDRGGIIPVYFYPELFYSRMPVKAKGTITDNSKKKYNIHKFNGFTIITDVKPVSLLHSINKFKGKGFCKFLIDFSYEPDIRKCNLIIKDLDSFEKIHGATDFNMKKGLH